MKRIYLFVIGMCLLVFPAQAQIQRDYKIVAPHTIESKNYYFTSLLQHFADADSLIRTSSALTQMAQDKQQRLEKAETTEERIAAMKFSEEEMTEAADALAGLYKPNNALGRILSRHIIPSGCYQQYKEIGADLVRRIWRQDAEGMNYAIDVYADARKPNYPAIDSIREGLVMSLSEYIGRKKDGSPNRQWSGKPATMIRKVALVQALREAFPARLGGMYASEERGFEEPVEAPFTELPDDPPADAPAAPAAPRLNQSSRPAVTIPSAPQPEAAPLPDGDPGDEEAFFGKEG